MVSSALGKRSRTAADVDFPSKRTRRQTRSFTINDENQDPAEAAALDEGAEVHDSAWKESTVDQCKMLRVPASPLGGPRLS